MSYLITGSNLDPEVEREKTISRLNAFLCSKNWHKWTLWKLTIVETFAMPIRVQARHCVICGESEQKSLYNQ